MLNAFAVLLVYVMPIGINNIGWKMYMINGSWDIIIIVLIVVYWVETKGRSLEEIDALFDGQVHSSVTDIEKVRKGETELDLKNMEHEITNVIEGGIKKE